MKKPSLLTLLILCLCSVSAASPRYIFYFIGDGMGPNAITLSEAYVAGSHGDKVGFTSFPFTLFPTVGYATTNAASRRVTDSAAAGTALATGHKTTVGTIGMDSSRINPLTSIAIDAKTRGMKVGITTTVSIDHATPASFYAHQPDRNMYYNIGMDAAAAELDLYAGAGFIDASPAGKPAIYDALAAKGYVTTRGSGVALTGNRALLVAPVGCDVSALPLEIDATDADLSLAEITRRSIEFLYDKKDKNGFFLMVEGGQIDWAAHSNDAASLIHEVISFSDAINVAMDFYRQHKNETLIVITADHETGGLALGRNSRGYDTDIELLASQKCSQNRLGTLMTAATSWDDARAVLCDQMGFGTTVNISDDEWAQIATAYARKASSAATTAVAILARHAGIDWTSGSHTSATVPVFAIGHRASSFSGRQDNTDIANKLRKIIVGKK